MHVNHLHEEAEHAVLKGDISKGINLMLASIKLNPDHPKLREDLGVIYMHAQMKEQSIDSFDDALRLEPDNPYRYSSRAFAKNYFKDSDGAITDYEKAIEMDPEDAITRNNLGLALEQKGYQKKAERHFQKSNDILGIKPKGEERIQPDSDKMKFEFENRIDENKPKGLDLSKTTPQITEPLTKARVVKNVFSKKETFKEFVQFVKSGFKNKSND